MSERGLFDETDSEERARVFEARVARAQRRRDADEPIARRPMHRDTDPDTSAEAGQTVRPALGRIQALVLEVFRELGPMTARKAERLQEFSEYGFSTIRKRISELAHDGYLVETGVDRSNRAPATVYGVPEDPIE